MSEHTNDSQQNNRLDDARHVVKKQLLKKLMQEAVDEIGTSDEAALNELVGSVKSEIDFSELRGRIKPLLKGELEKDLMKGLSEVEEKLSGQLKGILSRRALETAADSIDSEFLSRVSERVLEDHHGRISEQIESDIVVRIDRTAHGAIRKLLTEKREELQERVLGSIKDETIEEIRASVEDSIAETISDRIDSEGVERIEVELRESIRASIVERTVEGIRDSIDDSLLNRIIEQSVQPHREGLTERIREEFEAQVRAAAERAAQEFSGDDQERIRQLASGLLDDETRRSIGEQVRHVLSDSVVEDVRSKGFDQIEASIRERISEELSGRALELAHENMDAEFMSGVGQKAVGSFENEIMKAVRASVSSELDGRTRRAVRELLALDGDEFRSRISGSFDEAELDAVADRVKATVTNGLAQQIHEDGLHDIQKSLNDEVSMLLGRRAMEHVRKTVDSDYLESMSDKAFAEFGDAVSSAVRTRIDEELDGRTRRAIRDLLSADAEEFDSRVSGSLDEAELEAIADRIKDSVTGGLAAQIRENGLEELQKSVNDDIRELIGRHAIEHAHENIGDEYLDDVSRRALKPYSDRVESRIRSGLDSGVAKEARKAVDALMESGDHEILTRITDVMDPTEIEEMRERLVRTLSETMADAVRESGLDEIQKGVNGRLSERVEQDALAHLRSSIDDSTLARLSEKVVGELRSEISERMRRELDSIATEESRKAVDEESFVNDVASVVRGEEDLLETALDRVRELIVTHVADVSISRLDDVESVAQAARDHVSFDNDTLIAAMAMLRTKIMQDIARRTTKSLGSTDDVTEDAREYVNDEDPHVEEAASHVQRLALDTVRALARKKISDTSQMAARVAPEFDAESQPVQDAVEATRTLILDRIENLASERIANTDETALEASSRIEDDHESIQKAVSTAVSMLMDDVVRLTEWRLSWTEKVAAEARDRMGEEPADVSKAAAELESLLISEVAESTIHRLADTDRVAGEASDLIDRQEEVLVAAVESLRSTLVDEVARGAVESLADSGRVADEARGSIDPAHAHISSAVQRLRRQLMSEIADGAVGSMQNAEETAGASRALIGDEPEAVKRSQDHLRDMLLQEIGRSVLARFAQADEAAADAFARMDTDAEELVRARSVLRRQLVERLLADALSSLGSEVASGSDDAERTFFHTALRQVMGTGSSDDEDGGTAQRFRDRGPTPPKPSGPARSLPRKGSASVSGTIRPAEADVRGTGESGGSNEPAFRIEEADDSVGSGPRATTGPMITEPGWTILSEIDSSTDNRGDHGSGDRADSNQTEVGRTYSITEFQKSGPRPSSGDGIFADYDGDPDYSVHAAATEEFTFRMTVRPAQLRQAIRDADGDLTDVLGEFHPAGRVDGSSVEASAEALVDHAVNVLLLRLRTAGRPGMTENPGLAEDWLEQDEITVTSGSMYVAAEMEADFRSAATAAGDEFEPFGMSVTVESGPKE